MRYEVESYQVEDAFDSAHGPADNIGGLEAQAGLVLRQRDVIGQVHVGTVDERNERKHACRGRHNQLSQTQNKRKERTHEKEK